MWKIRVVFQNVQKKKNNNIEESRDAGENELQLELESNVRVWNTYLT